MKTRKFKLAAILLIVIISFSFLMSGCAVLQHPDFQEGFRQGWNQGVLPEYRY
ncbi:MAG: hypothetical protein FWE10_02185 [Rikenellaceae bacterium]|nr:hypothetical protein [Rikenellaceae bacterium]MCL2692023.1 hypothetical protein [Rikenellaceae bacterium]